MSRSGYSGDLDNWSLIKWRGQVASAIRGKRGQALLVDLAAALDAMPVKRLIADDLETAEGEVCALGAVARYRGVTVADIDPHDDPFKLATRLNIAEPLVQEIEYVNDEWWYHASPEDRWIRVREWVQSQLLEPMK